MFNPQDDPLGLGLQARARASRWKDVAAGKSSPIGPLPDPMWDGFFQAVGEATKGKQVRFGQSEAEGGDPTYSDPNAFAEQSDAVNATSPYATHLQGPSNQIGTASLSALKRLGRGR